MADVYEGDISYIGVCRKNRWTLVTTSDSWVLLDCTVEFAAIFSLTSLEYLESLIKPQSLLVIDF